MNLMNLFKKEEKKEKPEYSFCESVMAGPRSHWHIRKLTKNGQKFGGGIDTDSLCGCLKSEVGGWDLDVPMTNHHLEKSACKECAELYVKICRDK